VLATWTYLHVPVVTAYMSTVLAVIEGVKGDNAGGASTAPV
jgi:hypothetical protein